MNKCLGFVNVITGNLYFGSAYAKRANLNEIALCTIIMLMTEFLCFFAFRFS